MKLKKCLGVAMSLFMCANLISSTAVHGLTIWNADASASYAERYAFTRNTGNYPSWTENNCTNFVSQCLRAGGATMSDTWKCRKTALTIGNFNWDITTSWSRAQNLQDRLIKSGFAKSGGSWKGITGTNTRYKTGMTKADVITYDWKSDGTKDHSSIISKVDTVSSPTALVCANTNNQKNVIWTLNLTPLEAQNVTFQFLDLVPANYTKM